MSDKEFKLLNNKLSGKSTTFKTEIPKDKVLKDAPIQYNYNKIKNEILPKTELPEKSKEKYINCDEVVNLDIKLSDETFLSPKRRNRDNNNAIRDNIEEGSKKCGRKKKGDNSNSYHNAYSDNNIVKKIKNKIPKYCLNFVNSIFQIVLGEDKIKSYLIKENLNNNIIKPKLENLLKDLDSKKYADIMNREIDLAFFKMSIKDFLSIDISPIYSNYPKNFN